MRFSTHVLDYFFLINLDWLFLFFDTELPRKSRAKLEKLEKFNISGMDIWKPNDPIWMKFSGFLIGTKSNLHAQYEAILYPSVPL